MVLHKVLKSYHIGNLNQDSKSLDALGSNLQSDFCVACTGSFVVLTVVSG